MAKCESQVTEMTMNREPIAREAHFWICWKDTSNRMPKVNNMAWSDNEMLGSMHGWVKCIMMHAREKQQVCSTTGFLGKTLLLKFFRKPFFFSHFCKTGGTRNRALIIIGNEGIACRPRATFQRHFVYSTRLCERQSWPCTHGPGLGRLSSWNQIFFFENTSFFFGRGIPSKGVAAISLNNTILITREVAKTIDRKVSKMVIMLRPEGNPREKRVSL